MTFLEHFIFLPPKIQTSIPLGGGQFFLGRNHPRSIHICVPNVVMIGPAIWPPILDRPTHTQHLYYIDIDLFVYYFLHLT